MRDRGRRTGRKYAAVPNDAMRDKRISIEARGMLALLMTYAEHWVFRRDHLLEVSGVGKDKFGRIMRELTEAGYLKSVTDHDEKGRLLGKTWIIVDDPTVVRETRTSDDTVVRKNRCPEKPSSGKPAPIRKPTDKKTNREETPIPPGGDLFEGGLPQKNDATEDELFDRFWSVYPKKAGKPASRKAFAKAIQRAPAEIIIQRAKRYANWLAEKPGPGEFRPHAKNPQGWLNDDRWEDDALQDRVEERRRTYADRIREIQGGATR